MCWRGYTPIPQFCEFGFKLSPEPPPVYYELGLPYPLEIRFGSSFQEPLPIGATDLGSESFQWYRNFLMPGTGKYRAPTRRMTWREGLQRPVFPPSTGGWTTLRPPSPEPVEVPVPVVAPVVPH